jgi:hypothetical protein
VDSEVCSDVAAENMQGVLQEQEIVRKAEEEAVFQSNVDALMERRFLRTYLCRLRLQHLQEQHTALEQIAAEMKSFSIDLGSLRVTLEKNNGHLPAGLDFVAMQTPYMLPGQSEPAAVHCPLAAASEEASEETSPNEGGSEEQVTEAAASVTGGPSEEEAGGTEGSSGGEKAAVKSKESKGKTWPEKLAFLRVVEVLLGQAKAKSLELEELMALLNPTPSAAMLKAFGAALEELQKVDPSGLKTLQLPLVRFDCTGLGEVYHTMLSATEVMQEVVNMSHNVKEAKSATEGDMAADEGEEEASKPEGDEEGEKEQQMDEGKDNDKDKEITPEDVDVDQLYAMALRRIACGNALPAWINFLLEESDNRIKACGKVLRHIEALRYDDDVDSHVRRAALKQVHQLEG